MAYQFNGTNQTLSAPLAQGVPCTFACWARSTKALFSSTQTLMFSDISPAVGVYGGNALAFLSTGELQAYSIQQTPFLVSTSTSIGTYTQNVWQHCVGVWPSNSSRTSYLNGVESTTGSLTINTSPLIIYVGVSGGNSDFYQGQIAEVGIWNAALTAAEIASLAKGMTCDKIRPQSLVSYAPLVRDLIDQKGGLTITNNNGATVATHPRVYA